MTINYKIYDMENPFFLVCILYAFYFNYFPSKTTVVLQKLFLYVKYNMKLKFNEGLTDNTEFFSYFLFMTINPLQNLIISMN